MMIRRLHRLRIFHSRQESAERPPAMFAFCVLNLRYLRNLWIDSLGGTQWKG
jgi:hypothetical protein